MSRKLIVTDHAVLRYLERVHGVDIGGLRDRIAREARVAPACPIEGATAVRANGVRYLIANLRVTTVVPMRHEPLPGGARRRRKRTENA